jgi:hypothetical protein
MAYLDEEKDQMNQTPAIGAPVGGAPVGGASQAKQPAQKLPGGFVNLQDYVRQNQGTIQGQVGAAQQQLGAEIQKPKSYLEGVTLNSAPYDAGTTYTPTGTPSQVGIAPQTLTNEGNAAFFHPYLGGAIESGVSKATQAGKSYNDLMSYLGIGSKGGGFGNALYGAIDKPQVVSTNEADYLNNLERETVNRLRNEQRNLGRVDYGTMYG